MLSKVTQKSRVSHIHTYFWPNTNMFFPWHQAESPLWSKGNLDNVVDIQDNIFLSFLSSVSILLGLEKMCDHLRIHSSKRLWNIIAMFLQKYSLLKCFFLLYVCRIYYKLGLDSWSIKGLVFKHVIRKSHFHTQIK